MDLSLDYGDAVLLFPTCSVKTVVYYTENIYNKNDKKVVLVVECNTGVFIPNKAGNVLTVEDKVYNLNNYIYDSVNNTVYYNVNLKTGNTQL